MHHKNKKNIIWRVRSAYFISVISITMVLFILGITGLLLVNAKKLSDYAKENIGFTVYIKQQTKPADIDRLEKVLRIAKYSASTMYVSQEKAAEIMKEELGKDFTKVLGYNSLPSSIEVKLKSEYAFPDSMIIIKEELSKFSFIKEVFYQKNLISLVNNNIKKLSLIGFVAIVLLLITATALINNTIRLSVYSKRFLIRTAQLVGATKKFIRKPFIIRSIISGILSASISSLSLVFLILFLQKNFENIISIQGIWFIIAVTFIFGTIITGISSRIAVNKYLMLDSDELYY